VALREAVDEGFRAVDARLLRVEQEVVEIDAQPAGEAEPRDRGGE
jgi:hypothetical protein